jgi:Fe-S oxidoreductase
MDSVSSAFFREYAKKHEMKIRACCRFDKKLPSETDTALYFCQTCREVMESQGIHTKSMWEYIDEDPDYVFPDYSGMKFVIQDCWRDREHPEIHQAVRSLLNKMHIEYIEIPKSRENSDYCGTLHFETEKYKNEIPSFDHLSHYGEEMIQKLMEEKASQMNGLPVITCCARCC